MNRTIVIPDNSLLTAYEADVGDHDWSRNPLMLIRVEPGVHFVVRRETYKAPFGVIIWIDVCLERQLVLGKGFVDGR